MFYLFCRLGFYLFLKQYEYIKTEHQRIIEEAKELQSNLDVQTQQTISFETKLNYARKLLEQERKSRREAEVERDQMVIFNILNIPWTHLL